MLAFLLVFVFVFMTVELFVVMVVVLFVRRLVMFQFDVVAQSRNVQRIFMGGVGFRFGNSLRGADDFLNGRFVSILFFMLFVFFRFAEAFFFLFFALGFVFFEYGATCGTVGVSLFANFILLRVDQAR
jgi:hypothetical protein